jgi:N-acetylglucosaminyl-diphospho-decaprenol L-rhamnosyltransferase
MAQRLRPFADELRLIVVDCGQMSARHRELFANAGVTIVDAGGNVGFGRAVNRGMEHVTSETVGLINPDVQINVEGLRRLIEAGRRDGNSAWTGVLRNVDGTVQRNTAPCPSLSRTACEYLLGVDTRLRPSRSVRAVSVITGAAVFVCSECLRDVGGFDPAFPLYVEDVDLALRLRSAGSLTQFPIEIGVHVGGESSKHSRRATTTLLHASRVLFFRRQSARRGAVARGIVVAGAALGWLVRPRSREHTDLRQLWRATAPGFDLHTLLPTTDLPSA